MTPTAPGACPTFLPDPTLWNSTGHTPSFHQRNWYFIAPNVLANRFFYFWLGHVLGGLVDRRRHRDRS